MFEEDEEELELLRQYESKSNYGQDHQSASEEELDSDTEDKILSLIHYSSGLKKKKAAKPSLPSEESESSQSSDQESSSNEEESDEELGDELDKESHNDKEEEEEKEEVVVEEESGESSSEESETPAEPSVTRYINLDADNPTYIDDESEDDEEVELNTRLQDLIQDQIESRERSQRKRQRVSNVMVCFACNMPGHDRKDCLICADCGELKHEYRCNPLMYCNHCKRRGHKGGDCRYPRETNACSRCGAPEHTTKQCPEIVHTYTLGESSTPVTEAIARYCYNCGSQGHFGDECPTLPDYLRQVRTAFSIKNTRPKQIFVGQRNSSNRRNNTYEEDGRRGNRRERSRHDELDEFFSRRHHSSTSSNSNNGRRQEQQQHHFHHQLPAQRWQHRQPSRPPRGHTQLERGTGSNNWNAIPQPTRSGTVNVNNAARQQREQRSMDFPRGGNHLPRPSASGVIVPEANRQRAPRYRGGYNRK
ncbi:hypothetical protein BJV82DRAFT_622780 [Fennellomyces sp. T-0311]|nr:hypothetical protein BJV82DRAFT_622780 [Fennellomyces sp. T-0311]